MTDQSLPDDLADLERRLRNRAADPRHELRARELRPRVLRSVATELSRSAHAPWWRYAVAAAAVLMIGANLSLISTSITPVFRQSARADVDVQGAARMVRTLLPDLPADEARRMSITLLAANQGPRITPLPAISQSTTIGGLR